MGVPAPTINFVGMSVTLIETHRKAAMKSPYFSGQEPRKSEHLLEMQPLRFVMLGIHLDSYNAVVWVTFQFYGALNSWWHNHKRHAAILGTFDSLVAEIRKTPLLPNIRDDTITALLQLTQGSRSYAVYTQQFNNFFTRSC
jgi:cytochrome P450